MTVRPEDVVPIAEAGARLRELVDDATRGKNTILMDENEMKVAVIVDVHRLQQLEQLESGVSSPFTVDDVLEALRSIETHGLISEEEGRRHDQELLESMQRRADLKESSSLGAVERGRLLMLADALRGMEDACNGRVTSAADFRQELKERAKRRQQGPAKDEGSRE